MPTRCRHKYQSSFQGYSKDGKKQGGEYPLWRCRAAKQLWDELGVKVMAQQSCEDYCRFCEPTGGHVNAE